MLRSYKKPRKFDYNLLFDFRHRLCIRECHQLSQYIEHFHARILKTLYKRHTVQTVFK